MLVELVVLAAVVYLLVTIHRQDIAKGGAGVPVIGPYLEDLDDVIRKLLENHKKKTARNSTLKQAPSTMTAIEDAPSDAAGAPLAPIEKFEPIKQPAKKTRERSKSKNHHSKHRSKVESTVAHSQNSTD